MSTCISRHGEYSDHVLGKGGNEFICTRCWNEDTTALRAALDGARLALRGFMVRALPADTETGDQLMSDEISTEELLNMRVVPEQRADLAVVQAALATDTEPSTDAVLAMRNVVIAHLPIDSLEAAHALADDLARGPVRPARPRLNPNRDRARATRALDEPAAAVPTEDGAQCGAKSPAFDLVCTDRLGHDGAHGRLARGREGLRWADHLPAATVVPVLPAEPTDEMCEQAMDELERAGQAFVSKKIIRRVLRAALALGDPR